MKWIYIILIIGILILGVIGIMYKQQLVQVNDISRNYLNGFMSNWLAGVSNVNYTSPVNNSRFNVSNVVFNITSNATLSWCGVSINGSANVSMSNSTDKVFGLINSSIADGSYNFIITCNDSAGTFGNSGLNLFLIDTLIPTLTVFSPVNTSTYNSSSVLFNVSSSEQGTGSIIPDIDNSLVSWWRMDDVNQTGMGATVYDYKGLNNGTAKGNATQTDAGKLGKGMSFDGNGDYVNVPHNNSITFTSENFTVSLWAKLIYGSNDVIISKGLYENDGWYVQQTSTRKITVYTIQNAVPQFSNTINSVFSDNLWFYLTIVRSGSTVTIYINGTDQTSTHGTHLNPTTNVRNLFIGGYSLAGFEVNGTIDDVMIFNRSLSSDEILSIYNATKLQHTENLSDGSHTFKAYTQDLAGNMNNNGLISFNVSTTVSDTEYPQFSTYYDNNASLTDTGIGWFNVTVTSTNGTVILHINNSNILATNLTNDVYNASYNFTQSGTYLYNWTAYGNGTSTNLNTSINQYYVVNSSVSNCWTKTGTGRGSILYIPKGCVYQVNKGEIG